LVDVTYNNPLIHHPFVKIFLGSGAEIQHMGNFGKNRNGTHITAWVFFEKRLNSAMMLFARIKQGY
jgi:hypothetical protein